MDWKQWYGPMEMRRDGDTWYVPYQVWSALAELQHDSHVRRYDYIRKVALAGVDIDEDIEFDEESLRKWERPWR